VVAVLQEESPRLWPLLLFLFLLLRVGAAEALLWDLRDRRSRRRHLFRYPQHQHHLRTSYGRRRPLSLGTRLYEKRAWFRPITRG
jgi:hypothetical protein